MKQVRARSSRVEHSSLDAQVRSSSCTCRDERLQLLRTLEHTGVCTLLRRPPAQSWRHGVGTVSRSLLTLHARLMSLQVSRRNKTYKRILGFAEIRDLTFDLTEGSWC
jgi:hypothetical protein